MLNFESKKFLSLSTSAKLLLSYSNSIGRQIEESEVFFSAIGLKFPEDLMIFHQVVTEINNAKIDYSIEKIKFIPPTTEQCIAYLTERKEQKLNNLSQLRIIQVSNAFIEFYSKTKWKVKSRKTKKLQKMKTWRTALTAAEKWQFPESDTSSVFKSFDEFAKMKL